MGSVCWGAPSFLPFLTFLWGLLLAAAPEQGLQNRGMVGSQAPETLKCFPSVSQAWLSPDGTGKG